MDAFGTCRDHSGEHCTGLLPGVRMRPGITEPRLKIPVPVRDGEFRAEPTEWMAMVRKGREGCQRSDVGAWEFPVQLVSSRFPFIASMPINVLQQMEVKMENVQINI